MSMMPKHMMSEEDIKLQFITPAITSKWDIISCRPQYSCRSVYSAGLYAFGKGYT